MRTRVAVVAIVAVTVSVAFAGPTPAQRCASAKLKAASKKAAAKLKCNDKAIVTGAPVDPPCLGKAEDKFEAAFAKAELRGGCATTGDAGAVEAIVDAFVDDVVAALEPQVSFAASVQPIFSASCATSGCHTGAFPAGGLNLESGQAYANIVNVASSEVPALKRVLPGDDSSSYLYQKLTNAPGIVGLPMPLGSYPLPSDDIDAIEAWINQGALNN
jgi:hypothetical protein